MKMQKEKTLAFAIKRGPFKPSDMDQLGVHRKTLQRLVETGDLHKAGRGLYVHPRYEPGQYYDYARASLLAPNCVVCLFSALRFHEMTTEGAFEIWLAHAQGSRPPKITDIPVRLVTFSKTGILMGVDKHVLDGVTVKITSPAKTVVDCFKYRNKIGLQVALAALGQYFQEHLGTTDELWNIAVACRMAKVIRPYLEAVR